ncbi:MAG: 30S ribosomal protein S13 [Planctomyces sp.]|jgi:small subunit ribosomal protein S13
MIYLLETELKDTKPLFISLNSIFGVGRYYSLIFCKKLGISKNFKVSALTEKQKLNLTRLIENSNLFINSELKRFLIKKKKDLINIKSYKGLRKLKGFPVRGQRTRSNAKTAKKINIKI